MNDLENLSLSCLRQGWYKSTPDYKLLWALSYAVLESKKDWESEHRKRQAMRLYTEYFQAL